MPVPIASVDCGVDYLTCTFSEDADHSRLAARLSMVQRTEKREGNIARSWGLSGYKGESVGGLEWGYRHDGAIVRLSGFSAQRWWKRFGKIATNCSRIDLQETVIYDEHWSKTISRHWREMRRWYAAKDHRPEPKVIAGPRGPETIYSGKRVSDVFLRLYHRGSRPGYSQCEGHVRYETEFKGDRAFHLMSALIGSAALDHRLSAPALLEFRNRGCCLPWWNDDISRIRGPIKATDVERRLAWIARAVRPSIELIIEAGRIDDLREALGWSTWSTLNQTK